MTYTKFNITFSPLSNHPTFSDLSNQVFGRLTVLGYGSKTNNLGYWFCECECGNIIKVSRNNLISNHTKSCGCYRREKPSREFLIHGEYLSNKKGSAEIKAYNGAKHRCNNPKYYRYDRYGGRGIEFRFTSFEEFLLEVGERPSSKHSLDRINNDGHYEKGNVKWSTQKEQKRNTCKNIYLTIKGQTAVVTDWAELLGVKPLMVFTRKYRGWCDECAVLPPYSKRCQHRHEEMESMRKII